MKTPTHKVKRSSTKKAVKPSKMRIRAKALKARARTKAMKSLPKHRIRKVSGAFSRKTPVSAHKIAKSLRVASKALAKKNIEMVEVEDPEEVRKVENAISDPAFTTYMVKNVGSTSIDILRLLTKSAQTDEGLAAKLGIKINDVRRMLNMMNGYSFLRYDTNKDNKGWLIFKWHIDKEKLYEFEQGVNKSILGSAQNPNCNDFFFCNGCYGENKVVVPFDAAFETGFRCVDCGKSLNMLDKSSAESILKQR